MSERKAMLSLYNRSLIEAALQLPVHASLHRLLAARIAKLGRDGLLDMTHILVIQPGDTEAETIAEVGFTPLANSMDGIRFGSPDFHPSWDWLQYHNGWFELIMTVGNSGFAFVLLIQDADGVDASLLELCRAYCA